MYRVKIKHTSGRLEPFRYDATPWKVRSYYEKDDPYWYGHTYTRLTNKISKNGFTIEVVKDGYLLDKGKVRTRSEATRIAKDIKKKVDREWYTAVFRVVDYDLTFIKSKH